MLAKYAYFFVSSYRGLQTMRERFEKNADTPLSDDDIADLVKALEFAANSSHILQMPSTKHLAEELIKQARFIRIGHAIGAKMDSIESMMRKELAERKFLYVPNDRAASYECNDLFGPLVSKKIPKAKENIKEAGTCFALDRPTACVAHLMHAVAAGMELVAKNLSVKYSQPIEILDWQSIIQPIQAKIKDWQKHAKSQKKYDALEQYSKIATHFDYFKHAWRNKVSHAVTLYDIHQAKSVMSHTETFLQAIAASKTYKA
jgi:hypothetical protein